MAKEKIDWRIAIAGIMSITILEAIALFKGINGILLSGVLMLIAGIIGVVIPSPFKK